MELEEYVKEEFKQLNNKLDTNTQKIEQLMIFMAVAKAADAKINKMTALVIGALVSGVVSIASHVIEKML